MADKKNTTVSRRGFIGAIGAATAATALPAVALAAPAAEGAPSWPDAVAGWSKAQADLIARYREPYIREVVRFAEELRPRFESGELRGLRDEDDERHEDAREAGTEYEFPNERLEDLAADRFGIVVRMVQREHGDRVHVGDKATASVIVAVSPSAEHWNAERWAHPGYCAKACIAWDVLAVARALGFYEPIADEEPSATKSAWTREYRLRPA